MMVRCLGRMKFSDALALQEEIVARKIADPESDDELLLLEHEPVYTIGRTPDQSSLGNTTQLPHPVVQIGRGGQATYHGPGQLVGYPILDLRPDRCDVHKYVRDLEQVLIDAVGELGVPAGRVRGLTGVWIGPSGTEKKIAAIGVRISRWITSHGFALNVSRTLDHFSLIVPCGIADHVVTSIEHELNRGVSMAEVEEIVAQKFSAVFS